MRQPTEHVGFSLPYSNCLCILTFFVYQHENFTFSHTDTIQIFPTCSKPLAPRVYDNQHLKVNNSLMTNILVVYLECVEQFCISLNRSCYKQYRINVHIDQQMVLGWLLVFTLSNLFLSVFFISHTHSQRDEINTQFELRKQNTHTHTHLVLYTLSVEQYSTTTRITMLVCLIRVVELNNIIIHLLEYY